MHSYRASLLGKVYVSVCLYEKGEQKQGEEQREKNTGRRTEGEDQREKTRGRRIKGEEQREKNRGCKRGGGIDRELIMRLSPLYTSRLQEELDAGRQQGLQQGLLSPLILPSPFPWLRFR